MTGADQRFRFAQFEFPWALGPDDGRWVVRGAGVEAASHVLVLATQGAAQRRRFGGRRARPADPEPEPTEVATSRATIVDAESLPEAEAQAWLESLDPDSRAHAVDEALLVLNRALHSHRLAAADPGVHDVTLDGALVARLGYGLGDEVADGRWSAATEVPRDRRRRERRTAAMRPQERLAALLGGRDAPLACEELTLRARTDLDSGRGREAALQLRVALESAIAELGTDADPGRVGELREQRGSVGAAANEALQGPLSAETIEQVEHALGRVEAALRARSAGL